jgi:hypothetical protein
MHDRKKIPRRKQYGGGSFRRRIVVNTTPGRAVAEMEDDFHQFGVEVLFDKDRVTRITGVSRRYPWTSCPEASAALDGFVGSKIESSLPAIAARTEPDRQCTHQLDLSCLAIAGAALGFKNRRFDATVPEMRDRSARVTLAVDGEPRLAWGLEGMTISDPDVFSGRHLGGGFAAWVESQFSPEQAIEIHVLRRATFIGFGRQYDFDAMPNPIAFAAATGSRCHSFQPEVIGRAERIVGSGQNFDDRPDDLLLEPCILDG